tara:strand:+ start:186 stop:452 length:267 start_codon:yes stop_codon:yes gene_type:complete
MHEGNGNGRPGQGPARAAAGRPSARGLSAVPVMQICNGLFSLMPPGGTGGTEMPGCRFVAMINFEKSGQQTVIFHLQEAVVIQLQLYE